MEAINHCPVTRVELARAAAEAGVAGRLLIPGDGEVIASPGKYSPASVGEAGAA